MGPLTNPKHERFCLDIANLKSPADAAVAAGYALDASNAHKLLKRPEIKARVRELQDEIMSFCNVRRARIVVELNRVGRADITDFYDELDQVDPQTGKKVSRLVLKGLATLPRDLTAAIHSIETDRATGERRVRLHDKLTANITLLKYLGGLSEAPARPVFDLFSMLSADDQRELANALEAAAKVPGDAAGPTA